jgi:DNA mismatch repair ATPase MutS
MHGLIMRTTRGEDERRLRESNSSVKILSILKNGTHFTVLPLERVSERLVALESEYEEAQSRIVQQALDVAVTYLPLLEAVGALLSELDVLAAFSSTISFSPAGYCRPTMLTSVREQFLGYRYFV